MCQVCLDTLYLSKTIDSGCSAPNGDLKQTCDKIKTYPPERPVAQRPEERMVLYLYKEIILGDKEENGLPICFAQKLPRDLQQVYTALHVAYFL